MIEAVSPFARQQRVPLQVESTTEKADTKFLENLKYNFYFPTKLQAILVLPRTKYFIRFLIC